MPSTPRHGVGENLVDVKHADFGNKHLVVRDGHAHHVPLHAALLVYGERGQRQEHAVYDAERREEEAAAVYIAYNKPDREHQQQALRLALEGEQVFYEQGLHFASPLM